MPTERPIQFLFKVFALIGVTCYAIQGTATGEWASFVVAAPFAIVLVPGYLTALSRGQRHGTSCNCQKPDTKCEMLFWLEHLEVLIMCMPLGLCSIFLNYFVEKDVQGAVFNTAMAAMTMAVYSAACAYGFFRLSSHRTH